MYFIIFIQTYNTTCIRFRYPFLSCHSIEAKKKKKKETVTNKRHFDNEWAHNIGMWKESEICEYENCHPLFFSHLFSPWDIQIIKGKEFMQKNVWWELVTHILIWMLRYPIQLNKKKRGEREISFYEVITISKADTSFILFSFLHFFFLSSHRKTTYEAKRNEKRSREYNTRRKKDSHFM